MPEADTSQRRSAVGLEPPLREEAIVFPCEGEELLGILSRVEPDRSRGVIVVVGGPQYRAGSHRQFTLLARRLASAGYPTLRFDYRGMGDSSGSQRAFDTIDSDILAAISAFRRALPDVEELVLWGLCDGGSAIMMFGAKSGDIAGNVVLNPWVRNAATHAASQVKYYYPQRIMDREFWSKLLSGRMPIRDTVQSLVDNLRNARGLRSTNVPDYMVRMQRGLAGFPGRTLLVLSGNDLVAKELLEVAKSRPEWKRTLDGERIERRAIPDADHTFSRAEWRSSVEQRTLEWLASW